MQKELDEFTRGYLVAVSNLIGGFGRSTQSRALLEAIGATPDMIEMLDLTDYDRTNLADGLLDLDPALSQGDTP
ncbi:hypothetical protein [Sphingopyxis sp. Geo48]|uniref:hypothetical protein n=1 Tax=Sphingopyxis sp. Geo48 TaxID=545241 RepID=UPI0024B83A51|nr:hypothetical protein [Sphingopyxis sp. Geo48]